MRKKVEALENHAQFHANLVDVVLGVHDLQAIHHDGALVDVFQAVDGTQEGAFAGPGRADDHALLAPVDVQGDVVERLEFAEELVGRC